MAFSTAVLPANGSAKHSVIRRNQVDAQEHASDADEMRRLLPHSRIGGGATDAFVDLAVAGAGSDQVLGGLEVSRRQRASRQRMAAAEQAHIALAKEPPLEEAGLQFSCGSSPIARSTAPDFICWHGLTPLVLRTVAKVMFGAQAFGRLTAVGRTTSVFCLDNMGLPDIETERRRLLSIEL